MVTEILERNCSELKKHLVGVPLYTPSSDLAVISWMEAEKSWWWHECRKCQNVTFELVAIYVTIRGLSEAIRALHCDTLCCAVLCCAVLCCAEVELRLSWVEVINKQWFKGIKTLRLKCNFLSCDFPRWNWKYFERCWLTLTVLKWIIIMILKR